MPRSKSLHAVLWSYQGAQVKTFPSTTAALQALTARKVDAILVDQFFAYDTDSD
ncbi:hypothetical protein ACTQ9L_11445 [Deinococcus wulumuqiensis]